MQTNQNKIKNIPKVIAVWANYQIYLLVLNKKRAQNLTRYKIKPGSSQKVLESEQDGHRGAERLGNLWQQNSFTYLKVVGSWQVTRRDMSGMFLLNDLFS